MERLKIIKELNNVANILEENGRISEASQITNVLIKIAQMLLRQTYLFELFSSKGC